MSMHAFRIQDLGFRIQDSGFRINNFVCELVVVVSGEL